MRLPLALLALVIAAPSLAQDAAEPAEPAAYPARAVLAAFATACSGVENFAVANASAAAAGWEEYEPAETEALGQLIAVGQKMLSEIEDQDVQHVVIAYRREVAGRQLYLAINQTTADDFTSHGCRVYDFDATATMTLETLEEWAVRTPVDDSDPGVPGSVSYIWNPGLKPGHIEMAYQFAPKGALNDTDFSDVPISGHILTAQAIKIADTNF
ncbi:MAG: hypothetical protein AAF687_03990 [Pseudomonadota bacterium]